MVIRYGLVGLTLCMAASVADAQVSQRTQIKGNTEINVSTENTTAIATGENNVARNRIGVVKGNKTGNTRINVNAANVTTVVGGRNKKACTNIGSIVSDDCK
ncbi:MAG: hypothetical protein AUK53_07445 [Betaproteobacteria bacterium CG2_30_59_46]|nr:MAG: hypothetical protein AUK53_07445 [Betaproteobacteria bacterium CG2_30_59_46]